jgi:hypothetical protein
VVLSNIVSSCCGVGALDIFSNFKGTTSWISIKKKTFCRHLSTYYWQHGKELMKR